jgi:MFS-type transporter involved in bile tolerance (Atg22 family)
MPSTLTVFMVSMTSLAQILVFALVTPLADYGDLRKRMMTFSTVLGSVATACMAFVSADTYWVGCFLLLFSNVMFSISQVAMYAYLPVLLKVCCVSLLFQAFRMP